MTWLVSSQFCMCWKPHFCEIAFFLKLTPFYLESEIFLKKDIVEEGVKFHFWANFNTHSTVLGFTFIRILPPHLVI